MKHRTPEISTHNDLGTFERTQAGREPFLGWMRNRPLELAETHRPLSHFAQDVNGSFPLKDFDNLHDLR